MQSAKTYNMASLTVPANTIPMQLMQVIIATADASLRATTSAMVDVKRGDRLDIMRFAPQKYTPMLNSEHITDLF